MAKAILGHVGGPDPRLLAEVARLRRRVRDLEDEVTRLSTENEALLPQAGLPAEGLSEPLVDEIISLDAARSDRSAAALA
jgi:hypothetical protein